MQTSAKPYSNQQSAKKCPGRGRARLILVVLIVIALLLGNVPYLANFLSWQMTFFHELSHGLAALATGGGILKIELHFAGSGLCYTQGGLGWLILLAGYLGAPLWGVVIYLMAGTLPPRYRHILAGTLAVVLLVTGVLYIRDLQSWAIILAMAVFYAVTVKFRNYLPLRFILKLAALYIILDAFKAPLVLLHHQSVGDAAALARLTNIPQIVWIILWIVVAAGCLVFLWKTEKRRKPTAPETTTSSDPTV